MKKWLMMIMVVLLSAMTANATSISDSRKTNLMALPPFERACVLIRHYETLHEPKHWPTIAYGHVVQKGEKYKKRQYSHAEADRILRKDLSRLCAYYRGYGADSLLLACLAYNVGSGRIQNSTLLKKLKSGNRDIHHEYTSFSKYKGRRHPGLYRRRWMELELFFRP